MKAVDFSLPDSSGKIHKLSDYTGQYVVVYFYPKDDTPGCTKEACNFRDSMNSLKAINVAVLGISKDSLKSHQKFEQKYNLNFPLLSDETTETIKAYGAWGEKKFMGRIFAGVKRNTVLVGKDGEIIKNYENVNPLFHASEIIKDIEALER